MIVKFILNRIYSYFVDAFSRMRELYAVKIGDLMTSRTNIFEVL